MKKKITIVLVSVGFIALVLFALLPVLLSSGIVLDNIIARLNVRPGVTVKVANCDIGWFKGPVCSTVEYSDTKLGLDLQIDQVRGSQGLLALLAAPKNLGTIDIQQPVLALNDQTPGSVALPDPDISPEEIREKQLPPSSAFDQTKAPFWDTLVVSLAVEEGRVLVEGRNSARSTADGIYSATAFLAAGTVKYTLQWLPDGGNGKLLASGFINLPARQSNILETMVARTQLEVSDLQIAPLLTIASLWQDVPRGSGLLNGELTITGAGPDNLDVIGHLDCTDLELSGGVLGADHPRIKRLSLRIDGSKKGQAGWQVAQFEFEGDPGSITVSGEYGIDIGQIGLTGIVNLPIIFTQFPHFFHVQEETLLTRGELKFSVGLNRKGDQQWISADAAVDYLQGIYNNHPFSWDKPVTLVLAGEQANDELRIEQLNLVTSFLKAGGKGTRTDFSLQLEADFEKASLELGKLFALPWTGKGTLSLQAISRLTGEDRYVVDLQAESMKLLLLKDEQVILPEYPLRINGRLSLPSTWMQSQGVADLQLDGSAWPGRFFLRAGNLKRSGNSITAGYDLTARVNLGLSSDLLHNLQVLPPETTLAGQLNLSASGFLTEAQVVLRELNVRAEDFVYEQGEIMIQENNLIVQTKKALMDGLPVGVRKLLIVENMTSLQGQGFGLTMYDRVKQQLFLRDIQLRSTLADIDFKEVIIDDLKQPLQSWRAELHGRADLAEISGLFAKDSELMKGFHLAGQSRFVFSADQQRQDHAVSIDLLIPDCRIEKDNKRVLDGDEIRFSSLLTGLLAEGNVEIDQLEFFSPPVSFQAKGMLYRTGGEQRLVLEGKQKINFSRANSLVMAFTDQKVEMHGSHQEHFSLDIPLDKEGLKTARVSSSFQMDSLRWSGLEASRLLFPIALEDGLLQAGVHGALNGGRLAIDSTYRFSAELPDITLATGAQVLSGVQLDQTLTKAVLKKMHPLFGVLASPTGDIDARMDEFYWPVVAGGSQLAKFTAVFDVSELQLDSHGVLQDVLALLQLDDQALSLKESTITCIGKQGRISCTPVHILVADSVMIISGSVGMDQSLDYLLEIPVTKKLVGLEGFRVLDGTTIKIPLLGTLDDPVVNQKMISDAITDLAGQAAGKAVQNQVERLLPDIVNGLGL